MPDTDRFSIAVVGCGFVGGAVLRWCQDRGFNVDAHDPPKGWKADLTNSEIIFVCVPTPYGPTGFDDSIVRAAVGDIPDEKIVVIKSTVLPGTTESLSKQFPQHRIMFNPEFLRERYAHSDFAFPDRQIIGVVSPDHVEDAKKVLRVLPDPSLMSSTNAVGIVSARVAETIKYYGNCLLSMRITFANQMYDLCQSAEIDYAEVVHWVGKDARIGSGYLDPITDGYRGYGGTCFPKDMRALAQFGQTSGTPMTLIEAAEKYNNGLLAQSETGRQWLPPVTDR